MLAAFLLLVLADPRAAERAEMVRTQIEERGVKDAAVLEALRAVPRHLFVPEPWRDSAYQDHPLPIGHGQTISQPYIVAYMSEQLNVKKDHQVLEIGTGSGYQAAVLSRLAGQVYSLELIPELASSAGALLKRLGCRNVSVLAGDGYRGWPDKMLFDRILLTAAPPEIPAALLEQLKPGGRLIAPVGRPGAVQDLVVLDKTPDGRLIRRNLFGVVFVPMVRGKLLD